MAARSPKSPPAQNVNCSIARTLAVVGDRWTGLILRNAFHGMQTFDAFLDHLKVSPSVLSNRLQRLVDDGILKKQKARHDGRSFDYRLTEAGVDLYPVVVSMMDWGDKWRPSDKGTRLHLLERETGQPIAGTKVLASDGRELTAYDVRPVAGPAADPMIIELLKAKWGKAYDQLD